MNHSWHFTKKIGPAKRRVLVRGKESDSEKKKFPIKRWKLIIDFYTYLGVGFIPEGYKDNSQLKNYTSRYQDQEIFKNELSLFPETTITCKIIWWINIENLRTFNYFFLDDNGVNYCNGESQDETQLRYGGKIFQELEIS